MHTEKRFRGAAVAAIWLGTTGAGVLRPAAEGLSFSGLSPRTTIEEAQRRYPHSSIAGGHVYVSEADAHDHIYGIELARNGSGQIRVFFERPGKQAEYPPCERVRGAIEKQYGEPATVQEATEEASRNRRLIWRRGEEALTLLCFQSGGRPLLAAELTIRAGR